MENSEKKPVLETFHGFVDRIDGDNAYVTLHTPEGTDISGPIESSKLAEMGIGEQQRFTCRTIVDSIAPHGVDIVVDRVISDEEFQALLSGIRQEFEDYDIRDDY